MNFRNLTHPGRAALLSLAQMAQRHPRKLAATLATLLLTTGGGAFAVASFAPDPADMPVQTVVQPVTSLVDGSSLSELTAFTTFSLYRSDRSRSGDTAESLLERLGVADTAASAFMRSDTLVRSQLLGRNGRHVQVEVGNDHSLMRLTARWVQGEDSTEFQRLVIERKASGEGFTAHLETAPLMVGTRLAGGVIHSSLFMATDTAGIPDAVAIQIVDIFQDINFHRLFKGDRFSLVYETLEGDGEVLRTGRVLAAEFRHRGRTYDAMWFQEKGQKRGSYFALNGNSLQRAYIKSPVEFSRISSGFSMRMHPILKVWRRHLGTDYAAPTGARVRTIGDGVVDFAGWQNGFGNVVYVRHSNQSHVTVYAHLSRIDVKKGERVEQGATIGAVGSTGWATGPHLHFEFRVNGEHRDPLTIVEQFQARELSPEDRAELLRLAAPIQSQLAQAELIYQANAH